MPAGPIEPPRPGTTARSAGGSSPAAGTLAPVSEAEHAIGPLDLAAGYPDATADAWRQAVDGVLKGGSFERLVTTTADGIAVQPLYTAADTATDGDESGLPGHAPFVRGCDPAPRSSGAWDLRSRIDHPDPRVANRHALEELVDGATSLVVRYDRAFRAGEGSDTAGVGVDGVALWSADDLAAALDGVHLDLAGIELHAGARFADAAAQLVDVAARSGVDPATLTGTYGADPIGTLAELGRLPQGLPAALEATIGLARRAASDNPSMRVVRIDAGVHAESGATPALELAAMLATGAEYLRAFDAAGVDLADAVARWDAALTADADVFTSIAKLRAARRLWAALTGACGIGEERQGLHLVARASSAMLTRRDPWVNLLRVTAATFAAVTGGADAVITLPYDHELFDGPTTNRGRRLARNTQLILGEESHIGVVTDPGGGSWYVESLTDQLAQRAWAELQAIEAAGGMSAVLADGSWQERIAAAWAARSSRIATRKEPLTGVTEFPQTDEQLPTPPEPLDLAAVRATAGASAIAALTGDATTCEPLPLRRLAGPVEALRDAADAETQRRGARPAVFLANLGPLSVHTARAAFATNLYGVGGVGVLDEGGFEDDAGLAEAFAASGSSVACVCSSDAVYAERAVAAVAALKAAGATRIELAGRPGDLESALVDAGLDAWFAVGTDVIAHLSELHAALGIPAVSEEVPS